MTQTNKHYIQDIISTTQKIDNKFSRELYIMNIKEDIGNGLIIKYDLGNGIALFARSIVINKDIVLIEESNIAAGVFIFNLGEKLLFKYQDNKEHLLEKNNFLVALASNKFYSEVILKKNKQYITVSIGVKEELFVNLSKPLSNIDDYFEQSKTNNYALLKNDTIDPRQKETLLYFKDKNSYEEILLNLLLESKISDLAHYTIKRMMDTTKNKKAALNKDRVKSLQKAKEVILKEFNKELSIKDIAYKSTTNECYLKKDFKIYYGMTVYEMLQKHRMESAKELLQNDLGVKETAIKVGYKHSGNFTKTFFKYFNKTPRDYKKIFFNR